MAKLQRLRKERNRRRKLRSNLLNRAEQHAKRIKVLNAAIKRITSSGVPGIVGGWHEKAIRNQVQGGIGLYLPVPAKGVLHSTEGTSLPRYSGSHPHFTLDFKRRLLYQHIPVNSGAMALRNLSGGVETNRARAIQIELVGFAKDSPNWSASDYAQIAELMRWVEKHCNVKRQCSVKFVPVGNTNHLSATGWMDYAGWLGHQHIPEQDHTDPGALKIERLI